MTMPDSIGAPRLFDTVEQLQALIDKYFDSCFGVDGNGNRIQIRPITLEGLAYDIGCDRKTIWNYKSRVDSNNKPFFPAIKRAIDRCQVALIEHALSAKNPAGAIWLGCNNYDYVQKVEIQASTIPDQLSPGDIRDQLKQRQMPQSLPEPDDQEQP